MSDAQETRTTAPRGGDAASPAASLLVIQDGSSSRFWLPHNGLVLVGRVPEADLRLEDSSVSRRHARFVISDGQVRVSDLGSHNGTKVGGEAVEGARPLSSGDVVSIGDVMLVLHAPAAPPRGRPLLEPDALRARMEEEIERALRYARPLSVVALLPAAAQAQVQAALLGHAGRGVLDVAGWAARDLLVLLLPELHADAGREAAGDLLRDVAAALPQARAGLASCPEDGCDTQTLLLAARAAAEAAAEGTVAAAEDRVSCLEMDGRTTLVADPAMLRLYELIRRLAKSPLPVLITGETGAGKEHAAFAVHHFSQRRGGPFVALNCAAMPETLVESELFGHEKGAFSGATASKQGLLEVAGGGTVFLDEVGELPPAVQAKLLRALEARRITRVGDLREREIDIRVVAATHRDLEADVKAGRFRQDLYFRLGAATVALPALRERPRELPVLARTFLERACAQAGRAPMWISPQAMQRLSAYPWPGNVRELKNVMDYAAAAMMEDTLMPWHLPERISGTAGPAQEAEGAGTPGAAPASFRPLAEEMRELERRRMAEALEAAGGVQKRAAELIGMPLRTFVWKLKQHGFPARAGRGEP